MEKIHRAVYGKIVRVSLVAVVCFVWVQAAGVQNVSAQEEMQRRWDLQETPYADKSIPGKIGCNIRDGLVGTVDSLCNGLFSAVAILSPWGGFTAKKVVTIVGDVVGLVDNNIATKYVFKGILSRQLLRFGAGNTAIVGGLAVIHDTDTDNNNSGMKRNRDHFHHGRCNRIGHAKIEPQQNNINRKTDDPQGIECQCRHRQLG